MKWPAQICLLACLAVLAGCGDKTPPEQTEGKMAGLNAWLNSQDLDVPAEPYYVQPPDTIELDCPNIKEIDKHRFVVRSDGKIYVQLIGEVQVANLTPRQISEVMAQRLQKFYRTPSLDVAVVVVEFKSKSIYVLGQVVNPGIKPYTGRDTVASIIANARLNDLAWPQKVVLVRRDEDPKLKDRVTVDLKEMYEYGKLTHNYLLKQGDVIYVPPSPLAQAGMTFKKIFYPLIPATHLILMAEGL